VATFSSPSVSRITTLEGDAPAWSTCVARATAVPIPVASSGSSSGTTSIAARIFCSASWSVVGGQRTSGKRAKVTMPM